MSNRYINDRSLSIPQKKKIIQQHPDMPVSGTASLVVHSYSPKCTDLSPDTCRARFHQSQSLQREVQLVVDQQEK